MYRILLIVISLVMTAYIAGVLALHVTPEYKVNPDPLVMAELYEEHAVTSLMGEFRSTLSGYLWAKADEYLHGGVRMRPMTSFEISSGAYSASDGGDAGHEHHQETSVVPEQSRDPRGYWGVIEREVKPWFDIRSHSHKPPEEAIPLFRFMTWVDPHFIGGYLTGSYLIFSAHDGNLEQALSFLSEGLTKNPNSVALHTEYGRYMLNNVKDYHVAEHHLRRAVELSDHVKSNEWEQDAILDAYRFLVLLLEREGKISEARSYAKQGLSKFPQDVILRRILTGQR
jgi:tetratricopeptide (TPR) repeat protein